MNAGVIGDKKLMNLTADGVTALFATNVLGHVVLLEGLLNENRLGEVAILSEVKQPEEFQSLGFSQHC